MKDKWIKLLHWLGLTNLTTNQVDAYCARKRYCYICHKELPKKCYGICWECRELQK